jgi:hypothetical protein
MLPHSKGRTRALNDGLSTVRVDAHRIERKASQTGNAEALKLSGGKQQTPVPVVWRRA